VAKSFIGRALFHTPGGEMNFASTGSDNNIRYVMKRLINHYGLFLWYVKQIVASFRNSYCPAEASMMMSARIVCFCRTK